MDAAMWLYIYSIMALDFYYADKCSCSCRYRYYFQTPVEFEYVKEGLLVRVCIYGWACPYKNLVFLFALSLCVHACM